MGHTAEWTGLKDFTDPTGAYHRGKTLWDWLELLVIPIALGIGLWWLNRSERRNELRIAEQRAETERQIATDRLREEALQEYLDRMSDLLLEKHLLTSERGPEVREVARVRTLTVVRRLDPERKAVVLNFLHVARLINKGETVVHLNGADLRGIDMKWGYLEDAQLSLVNLSESDLSNCYLIDAELDDADLNEANLSDALLDNVSLQGANLTKVNLRGAHTFRGTDPILRYLCGAGRLRGAIMTDGNLYNGCLNLQGDLEQSKTEGIATDDAGAMARFYGVSLEDYQRGQKWARENLPRLRDKAKA